MWLNKIKKFFLDLFFPKKCLGCNRPDTYLCQDCFTRLDLARQDKIEIVKNNFCPFCEKIMPQGMVCKNCEEKYNLNRLIWATPYHDPLIKNLIRSFKYHYVKELAGPLSELLIKSLKSVSLLSTTPTNSTIIVPIPLHKRKLHQRDFNQAELLAKKVAENFSIPLEAGILLRKKYTPQQARIKSNKNRREALKDAFEINPDFAKKCVNQGENLLRDKTVILVDDVATTGATLSEAAKILKQAGAKEIWGFVVAKG